MAEATEAVQPQVPPAVTEAPVKIIGMMAYEIPAAKWDSMSLPDQSSILTQSFENYLATPAEQQRRTAALLEPYTLMVIGNHAIEGNPTDKGLLAGYMRLGDPEIDTSDQAMKEYCGVKVEAANLDVDLASSELDIYVGADQLSPKQHERKEAAQQRLNSARFDVEMWKTISARLPNSSQTSS